MIPSWIRNIFVAPATPADDGLESKLRGMQNMKTLNDLLASGQCAPAQLDELELGAETISLNLKRRDTDRVKGNGGI